MTIPVTLLAPTVLQSMDLIKNSHTSLMYRSGVNLLTAYNQDTNSRASGMVPFTKTLTKWFGSEKFLYDLVDKLGERVGLTAHMVLKDQFDIANTNKPPSWIRQVSVKNRQIARFMQEVDLFRLEERWRSKMDENNFAMKFRTVTGLSPNVQMNCLSVTKMMIRQFIRHYELYRTNSLNTFFTGNPYINLNRQYRTLSISNLKRIPRTCSLPTLERLWRNRHAPQQAMDYSQSESRIHRVSRSNTSSRVYSDYRSFTTSTSGE